MKPLLAFLVAYIGSRAIFAAFGFKYAVFHEPLDIGMLAIDFGVFGVLFGGSYWLIGKVKRKK